LDGYGGTVSFADVGSVGIGYGRIVGIGI